MMTSLTEVKNMWSTTTDYNSPWLKLFSVIATVVVGWAISWELSGAWEEMFGYSSVITVLTTILVLLTLYFCFSYVITQTSKLN
ncbi:hypothetical protein [Halostagnicola kamekurae]|uniref:Uncharacterized protein n=1 Tax=Halostagnicola kamekurae TaxID=619731 RepID=A0A1I6TSQ2_9EURY|nr:hypothetical protein [Halostagnicola kamekurae]SFS92194.1 hypothetical protein SAMN04488556_3391 [Halostagnicola kamekurae]